MNRFLIFAFCLRPVHDLVGQTSNDTVRIRVSEIAVDYEANANMPFAFSNLKSKELESLNAGQEPSFLLQALPSMTVYSDAGSYQGYSYIRLRGMDQTRISMSLDGVPLNEPEDQGVYFSNYPDLVGSLDAIQVQRGVGTSKNGTSSYAGSVLLSSPNLFDSTDFRVGFGGGSFGGYRAFAEYNSGVRRGLGTYVRASHLHSDGYKYNSRNTSSSAFYALGRYYKRNSVKFVGFTGIQSNELAWIGVPEEDIVKDPRSNANGNEQDQFLQSLSQIQWTNYPWPKSALRCNVYHNYLNGNYDFDLNNFLGYESNEELYNYAFESHLVGGFANYAFDHERGSFSVGLHANAYHRKHVGSEKLQGELYTNWGLKRDYSAFAKYSRQLGAFRIFADLQARQVGFSYLGAADFIPMKWSFLNPKVGLIAVPNPSASLYYSIGRAGREPTRNDLFGGMDDLGIDEEGRPSLFITEAEFVTDQELGVRFQRADFAANVNAYHLDFTNEIVLNGQFGPNGLALSDNVEKSYRLGLEFDLCYELSPYLRLRNQTSFNRSRITTESLSFAPILTPAFLVNQDVELQQGSVLARLSARYQSPSYLNFANVDHIEAYVLLNAQFAYKLRDFTFSIFANNITNAKYYNAGYIDLNGTKRLFVQAPLNLYFMLVYSSS
jgi:iron complex outermembrane receptor protein